MKAPRAKKAKAAVAPEPGAADAAADSAEAAQPEIPRARIVGLLREARALEELLERLADAGRIGTTRPAGDARTAMIGAGIALQPGDLLFGTARDLPAALARGANLELVLRQAFAVSGDPALGRGLPGALQDASLGLRLGDGGAANHLVHAAGFGHAARIRREPRVAVALFGSAAQAQGDVHAALGFAAVYKSQTIFVARGPIEDELWLDEIGDAWGIRAVRAAGDDAGAVYAAVAEARARAVCGEGPTVIDARLCTPAQPVDERIFRDSQVQDAAALATVAADIRRRLTEARAAAESAVPISEATLPTEVFAVAPWFLARRTPTERAP
ncbi:MAG: thiamine pyrophosphate-dependent enzyme [Myxococcota bacterium]